jgi:hypothetical protein
MKLHDSPSPVWKNYLMIRGAKNRSMGIVNQLVLLVFLMVSAISVFAGPVERLPSSDGPRSHWGFDYDWRFIKEDPASPANADFDDSTWSILNLRHDWSIEQTLPYE